MGLNIKNADVETNIRRLAARTGESLTDAVDLAVREKLARLEEQAPRIEPAKSAGEFLKAIRPLQESIGNARKARGDRRSVQQVLDEDMDKFYDESGLPR
jgi:antitoxin VapB